jgi:hypothetical protein
MLDDPGDAPLEPERRHEAVRLGRRALGPGLRRLFDALVSAPAPEEWLVLLRKAEDAEEKRRA